METIKLPELPEVLIKGIVAVRSEDLKVIVNAFNELSSVVVKQNAVIEQQNTIIQNTTMAVKECREDISKIAKILEDIYET